jgi:ABC-type glycerol-3-phosphate transport system substrate-binding protein
MNRALKTILLCLTVFLIAAAFGFAGGQQEGAPEQDMEEAEMTGEFKLYHDNPEWQENWVTMGEASEEEIGIKAVPTEYDTEVYKSRVKVDLGTNRAPGAFKWWFGYRAKELLDAGLIADLSDVWDDVGDNYADGIQDALTLDGVTYAFPFNVGYWVWYYSKAAYDEMGFEPPETWDEFMSQLAAFEDAGIYGIGNTIGNSRWTSFIVFQEILYRIDHEFYTDLVNGRAHYTDPQCVQAMEIWKEMLEEGYFAPMDATYVNDFPRMMKEGSLAVAPFGDWYGGILQQQGLVPEEDYGVMILPPITDEGEGAIILEVAAMCAGKNSPNLDLAKEWFRWYSTSQTSADLLWDQWKFATNLNVTTEMIQQDDPVLAYEYELLDDYPVKLIRFWEATPVEIVEQAVDEFNTMLVSPGEYMNILSSIEARAAEVWPDYGVDY